MRIANLASPKCLETLYIYWRKRHERDYYRTSHRQAWVWPKLAGHLDGRDPVIWMWSIFYTYGNVPANWLLGRKADTAWRHHHEHFWDTIRSDYVLQTKYLQALRDDSKTGSDLGTMVSGDLRFDPLFKCCALIRCGYPDHASRHLNGARVWLGSVPYLACVYADIPEELTTWLNRLTETSCCCTSCETK